MTDFILNRFTTYYQPPTYYRGAALTRVDPSQIAGLNGGMNDWLTVRINAVLCVRSDGQIVESSQALATPFNTFCVISSDAPPGEVWFQHVAADDLMISGALGDLVANVPPGAPTLKFSWDDDLEPLLFDGELLWGRSVGATKAYAYAPSNPTPVVAITAPRRTIVLGTYIAADGKVYVGVITHLHAPADYLAVKAFCTNPLTEISVDDAVWDGLSLTQIAAACDADPNSYAGVGYFGGYHRLTIVMGKDY